MFEVCSCNFMLCCNERTNSRIGLTFHLKARLCAFNSCSHTHCSQCEDLRCARTSKPDVIHVVFTFDVTCLQDAVPLVENDYARVHDALPFGKIHRVRTHNRKGEKGTRCTHTSPHTHTHTRIPLQGARFARGRL